MSNFYKFSGASFINFQNETQHIEDGVWEVNGPPNFDMVSIDFGQSNRFLEMPTPVFLQLVQDGMAIKQSV